MTAEQALARIAKVSEVPDPDVVLGDYMPILRRDEPGAAEVIDEVFAGMCEVRKIVEDFGLEVETGDPVCKVATIKLEIALPVEAEYEDAQAVGDLVRFFALAPVGNAEGKPYGRIADVELTELDESAARAMAEAKGFPS